MSYFEGARGAADITPNSTPNQPYIAEGTQDPPTVHLWLAQAAGITPDAYDKLWKPSPDRPADWQTAMTQGGLPGKRMGLFTYVADKLSQDETVLASELTPVQDAWDLLAFAQREMAGQPVNWVGRVIVAPATGGWLGYMIRRFAGKVADDGSPLWIHASYLHTLAAVAAVKAGLKAKISLPVLSGKVTLPDMGQMTLASTGYNGTWDVTEATVAGESLSIANGSEPATITRSGESGAPGWRQLRTASAPVIDTPHNIHIALDHLNPYRSTEGFLDPANDPHTLDPANETAWLQHVKAGLQLLGQDHPRFALMTAGTLRSFVPTISKPRAVRFRPASSSGGDTVGAIEFGRPHDTRELAATIVHELHHNLLSLITLGKTLVEPGEAGAAEIWYTGWRDDPRPILGVLHGIISFLGVAEFAQQRLAHEAAGSIEERLAQYDTAHWRQELATVMKQFDTTNGLLTTDGQDFLDVIKPCIASLHAEPLPGDIVAMANTATTYHHARWLAHHLQPDAKATDAMASAWLHGDACPSAQTADALQQEVEACRFDTWGVLARLSIAEPETITRMQHMTNPETMVEGATLPDVLYYASDVIGARQAYLNVLSSPQGCTDAQAIVGLGLTLSTPNAQLLQSRPQLYRAVQKNIVKRTGQPADPLRLLAWLSQNTQNA
jgi:HEXXH motif-containing protein